MAEKPLTDSINALTIYINEITGGEDTNLSDAIATLTEGYGSDGISIDNLVMGKEPHGDVVINKATFVQPFTFAYKNNITSIYSDTITRINVSSFSSMLGIITVNLPELTDMGGSNGSVFASCTSLKTFLAPKLKKITQNSFSGCNKLVNLDLRSVETIIQQAFNGCKSITHIYLPKCVSIGARAFNGCTALTDIYLPNDEATYTNVPWNAPSTCTIHYNTVFGENGEPVIE